MINYLLITLFNKKSTMPDLICPYSATLAQKKFFSCPNADEVIRRGGSEYICLQPMQFESCNEVHNEVKQSYLTSQGLEDDLLSLPHSTYVKIQFGCVLGLQSLGLQATLGNNDSKIDDISLLISDAIKHYKNSNALPFELLNEKISTYKLQKRKNRGQTL